MVFENKKSELRVWCNCYYCVWNKRRIGTSTNVSPTNGGCFKCRTLQTLDLQTSDWYKRRTGTNGRPVQTADQYKCRTGTNGRPVQTSDWNIYKEKYRTLVKFERKDRFYNKKNVKSHIMLKIKDNWIKSHPLKVALFKTTDNKGFGFNSFNFHKL